MASLISSQPPPSVNSETAPRGRAGHCFLPYTKEGAVLIGGYNDEGPLDDVWLFDGTRNVWVSLSYNRINPNPLPRIDFAGSVLLENKLFVLGGMESDGEQVLIYNDLWQLDLTTGGWTMVTEECPLAERMGHVCVGVDSTHMLVHGGECMGRCFDDVWLYNATSNAWTLIEVASGGATNAAVPVARCAHTACFLHDTSTLLIFGGYTMEDGEPVYLNDLWALDLSRLAQGGGGGGGGVMQWRQVTCVNDGISPSPRDQPALMTLPPAVGAGAGAGAGSGGAHRVFIGGGYGLTEVGEGADSDAIAMDTDTDNEAGAAAAGEGGEEEGVELGYLNDCWLVELDLVAAKAVYTELWTDSDECKAAAALWAGTGNAGRRGCKVLASADGGIVSFGGFTGEHFSHALERTGNL